MLNPSQITYSPVELFTLKPAPVKLDASIMKAGYGGKTDINSNAPQLITDKPSFWGKNKWIIIGGVLVVGGICWYAYKKNQNDSSKQAN